MMDVAVPYFSIIIPAFNRAHLLGVVIDSVCNQEYSNWELLVIDDGSVDNTREVVLAYLTDKRIKYIYQENAERSAARNKGIENAKGKYICFLDSDDLFYGNHLSVLHGTLVERGDPVVFARTFARVSSGGKIVPQDFAEQGSITPVHYVLTKTVFPCNVCIHNEILYKHRFNTELSYGEDYDLWIRILLEYPLLIINKHTAQYNLHEENSSASEKSGKIHEKYIKSFKVMFSDPRLRKVVPVKIINSYFSRRYQWLIQCYLENGNSKEASRTLWLMLKGEPKFILRKQFYTILAKIIFR